MSQKWEDDGDGLKRIVAAVKAPPPHDLPADFADRVVEMALQKAEQPAGWARALRETLVSLFRPRQILLRPVWQVAYGVALCAVTVAATMWGMRESPLAEPEVLVRFTLKAPGAHRVALAGDFNAWGGREIQLRGGEGNAVWQVVVPLRPGVYQYMFVVDGTTWVPDPAGDQTVDDGFGHQNSLMKVANAPQEIQEGTRDDQRVL